MFESMIRFRNWYLLLDSARISQEVPLSLGLAPNRSCSAVGVFPFCYIFLLVFFLYYLFLWINSISLKKIMYFITSFKISQCILIQ